MRSSVAANESERLQMADVPRTGRQPRAARRGRPSGFCRGRRTGSAFVTLHCSDKRVRPSRRHAAELGRLLAPVRPGLDLAPGPDRGEERRRARQVTNSRYFGQERGVTYWNLTSDLLRSSAPSGFTGPGGIVVPGTLALLSVLLEQKIALQPKARLRRPGQPGAAPGKDRIDLRSLGRAGFLTLAAGQSNRRPWMIDR